MCKICKKSVFMSTQKLASHKRQNCKGVSKEEREYFDELLHKTSVVVQPAYLTRSKSKEAEIHQPSSSSVKPSSSKIQVITCSKAQEREIDSAMADYFFRRPTAFRTIDSKEWKALVTALNPAYAKTMKSSKTLAGSQLRQKYTKYKGILLQKLKDANGYVICSDGWTSVRNEHLINFLIIFGGDKQPHYYKTVNTSHMTLDAPTQKKLIVDVATELGIEKWRGCIVDNASVMQVAMELIEEEFPSVSIRGK